MKAFRKTLQESRLKTHHLIRSWLQPKLGAVGTKYRLAGRIRLANIWARKHPRRTFAYVTGSLFFLLASTVLIDGIGLQNNREPDVSSIAQLEPVFAGVRTIQANKSIHRSTLTELTQEGQQLRDNSCGRNWTRSLRYHVKAIRIPSISYKVTTGWNPSSNHFKTMTIHDQKNQFQTA